MPRPRRKRNRAEEQLTLKARRFWSAGGPVEQLHGVQHRHGMAAFRMQPAGDLHQAADIARRHHLRAGAGDVPCLARAQLHGQFGLQQVVGAGRTAA